MFQKPNRKVETPERPNIICCLSVDPVPCGPLYRYQTSLWVLDVSNLLFFQNANYNINLDQNNVHESHF